VRVPRPGHRRLLLSHDVCKRAHLKAYGGTGYDFVPTRFADRLEKAGVSREQITTLLVDNPRAALTGRSPG
jgi:phosphotriesterase-related protein